MLELTVFIRVKIDNLKELSKLIPEIVIKEDNINKDNINTKTEIKYLFISFVSTDVSENSSLLIKTFIGFACETSSFMENLNNE